MANSSEKLPIEELQETEGNDDFDFPVEVEDEETRKQKEHEAQEWWVNLKKRMKANK
jgi:hypothetical protein